jgi:DNA invertase Pin-like site-specific DNA recombinase
VKAYKLEGVSGKRSLSSPQIRELGRDIACGRINTIMCTAIDRLSRNTREFLEFADYLADHDANLVILRQRIDTTSPTASL